MSRRHDQSYKLLFSIPLAVEQLIRHFLDTDLADELYHAMTATRPRPGELAPGGLLPPTLAVTSNPERSTRGCARRSGNGFWELRNRGGSGRKRWNR